MAFVAVVGCAVRRVSAPGIALANAQCADGPAGVLSGRALPPGAGLGNAQMDQLVAGTAAAGGGRSQMADGEGREGRWWPVGGLARTKPAALRATRLLPCVVTLGLASNTPRRRPLNTFILDRLRPLPTYAPAGSHACGCGWGVVQIYYLYWLVGVCAYVCVCGLCLSNGGLAPV